MSDIGEAVGTAVEGGLFARAVSGPSGQEQAAVEKGHFAEDSCLNCGTLLTGPHCHQCGQKAHLHRTLGAFMHDMLHGALHFDGKTWRTLPKLAFKPGELTRRYIEGERARFVSPMALFLFSIFLMFAVFQLAGITTPSDLEGSTSENLSRMVGAEDILDQRVADARDQLAQQDLSPEERAQAQARLDALEGQARRIASGEDPMPAIEEIVGETASGPPKTDDPSDTPSTAGGTPDTAPNINFSGIDWIDGAVEKWRNNPTLMLYKLQTNFYKFSWLLIPLSIPFVWLLFVWKPGFGAYDHSIFVTYSLSFMTLLILAITLSGLAGMTAGWLVFASLLIPPLHIYKQLRGAYGLSRFSAFWRLAVLSVFIVIVMGIFLQLLLLIGAF